MQQRTALWFLRVLTLPSLFWLLFASPVKAAASEIITLAPHITELVFAAGADDQIKATVDSSDYPAQARELMRVGNGVHINVETLLALQPDIVIAWQPTQAVQALHPALKAAGIELLFSAPRTLDDIPREIRRFGTLLNGKEAEQNARSLQDRIDTLRDTYALRPLVRVYIDLGAEPLYTLGNDPLLNDVLAICRGVNVYAGSAMAAPLVSLESVLSQQPDAIITATSSASHAMQRRAYWKSVKLNAALHDRVYAADRDLLFRPGPRLIDAAETLCADLDKARHAN